MPNPDELKRRAALAGADLVQPGMVVGLGTGSTANYLVDELGRRMQNDGLQIVGIATSEATRERAMKAGIPLVELDERPEVDITLDGADEVDPQLDLIKGRGGALLREKIVAAASRQFVILVDETKLVDRLGHRVPVPIEIVPFARLVVERLLGDLHGTCSLRRDAQSGQPFVTDSSHWILDCDFDGVPDPAGLEAQINNLPGVVENGLFVNLTDVVVVGTPNGVEIRRRDGAGAPSMR
jgi:ribose 5-phosphate isomerase A